MRGSTEEPKRHQREGEKRERTRKQKKNSRWSNLQTEAKQIKEEDTQMSGVTEKTEEEGEQTDFETADEDGIVDENTTWKLRWGMRKQRRFTVPNQ